MPTRRPFVPAADWQDPRHRRGLRGEYVAMAFLSSCGWSVEAHRFRLGQQDIDLIVRRGAIVAFVEVKTRRSASFGAPIESIGWRKRRAIARVASVWMLRHGRPADTYRFDVVSVQERPGASSDVEHLPDAWRLERSVT